MLISDVPFPQLILREADLFNRKEFLMNLYKDASEMPDSV
jgi:hypothetical protein